MGLWWEKVGTAPEGVGITLEGDPNAWPRTQRIPFLWRTFWRWQILVHDGASPVELYFLQGATAMRFKARVEKRYIAVRIGPGAVRFVAINAHTGREMPLHTIPVFGRYQSDEFEESAKKYLKGLTVPGRQRWNDYFTVSQFVVHDVAWV